MDRRSASALLLVGVFAPTACVVAAFPLLFALIGRDGVLQHLEDSDFAAYAVFAAAFVCSLCVTGALFLISRGRKLPALVPLVVGTLPWWLALIAFIVDVRGTHDLLGNVRPFDLRWLAPMALGGLMSLRFLGAYAAAALLLGTALGTACVAAFPLPAGALPRPVSPSRVMTAQRRPNEDPRDSGALLLVAAVAAALAILAAAIAREVQAVRAILAGFAAAEPGEEALANLISGAEHSASSGLGLRVTLGVALLAAAGWVVVRFRPRRAGLIAALGGAVVATALVVTDSTAAPWAAKRLGSPPEQLTAAASLLPVLTSDLHSWRAPPPPRPYEPRLSASATGFGLFGEPQLTDWDDSAVIPLSDALRSERRVEDFVDVSATADATGTQLRSVLALVAASGPTRVRFGVRPMEQPVRVSSPVIKPFADARVREPRTVELTLSSGHGSLALRRLARATWTGDDVRPVSQFTGETVSSSGPWFAVSIDPADSAEELVALLEALALRGYRAVYLRDAPADALAPVVEVHTVAAPSLPSVEAAAAGISDSTPADMEEVAASSSLAFRTPSEDIELNAVTNLLRHRWSEAGWCYENALSKVPSLEGGAVTVRFVIDSKGELMDVKIVSNTTSPEVGECLVTRARGWRYPKPNTDRGVQLIYAFAYPLGPPPSVVSDVSPPEPR